MDLSVVIPVFQLEGREATLLAYMQQLERALGQPLRFILVDDASPDQGLVHLKALAKQAELDTVCIKLDKRLGQYTATAVGLSQVQKGWSFTVDDDGQHLPETLEELLQFAKQRKENLMYGFSSLPNPVLVRALKAVLAWGYPASRELSSCRLLKFPFEYNGKRISYLDGELMDQASGVAAMAAKFAERTPVISRYTFGHKGGIALRLVVLHNRLPWYIPALLLGLLGHWAWASAFLALLGLSRFGRAYYQRPISWSYL